MSLGKSNNQLHPGRGMLVVAILAAAAAAPASLARAADAPQPAPSTAPVAAGTAPATALSSAATPASAPAPAAAPAPNPAAPDADMDLSNSSADDEALLKAISAMEEVSASKEKSVRAKAALTELQAVSQLPDMALGGSLVSVVHRNELPSQFVLVGAAYTLDDKTLFTKADDSGTLNLIGEQVVGHEHVEPGRHRLAVEYHLRGNSFGLLSYLEDLQLTVRQSFSFIVDSHKSTTVAATLFSTGNLTREFKDRPGVSFVETVDREPEGDKQADSTKATEAGAASPTTSGQ